MQTHVLAAPDPRLQTFQPIQTKRRGPAALPAAEKAVHAHYARLAKWRESEDLGRVFVELNKDRQRLMRQVESGVVFALKNVQSA